VHPQDLLALLGRYNTDPLVEGALSHYAVRNRPEVTVDERVADGPVVETQSWVKNSRAGIEFGFDDEAAWIGLDETEFGKRPMLLTQIYMYGQHDGVRPYQDPLPFGLQLSDDRVTVRKKLNALESTRHSHVRDTWDAPGFRVTVAFTEGDRSIDFVICTLREPALPALGYALQPVPAVERLVGLLGRPISDSAIRLAFDPLGLEDQVEHIKDTCEADFRNPYGFSLVFSAPIDTIGRDLREIVLSRVTLYQERELDARAWPAELPYAIRFDDSPETAVGKVGRPPDIQDDESFSGHAVWHESTLTLHIFYSTMENRILRVSLIAPGY
jgi:hypothetical protein